MKKPIQLKLFEKTYLKLCEFCGKKYTAYSINSKYCSASCNIKACDFRKDGREYPIYSYPVDKTIWNIDMTPEEEEELLDSPKHITRNCFRAINGMKLKKCPECNRLLPYNKDFFGEKKMVYCHTCMKKKANNKRKNHTDSYSANPSTRYSVYKNSAKKRGLSFNLTKDEAIKMYLSDCWYCGYMPIDGSLNGIDRIDASQGYEKHNVVACCKRCNYMKGMVETKLKITREEFLDQIYKINDYQHRKNKTILD